MSQRTATITSLPTAFEVVKAMQGEGLDWGEGYRPLGRQALAEIIEDQMAATVDRHLEQLQADEPADRRNGSYRRHLLTELGDIGLNVPRTRRYNPVEVVRAYARRTREVDRAILAGFVLGLSTRKVENRSAGGQARHKIMNAANVPAARAAARKFANRFKDKYPAAVDCLRNDLDERLTCFRYKSEEQRRKVRTTNAIERRFREVRRRTRPMGTFQDRTSMDRILFAVFTHENKSQGVSGPFLLTQNN